MSRSSLRASLKFGSLAVVAIALGVGTYALAGSSSDESRIDARLTKDADDHLKGNLADEKLKVLLKDELRRGEAIRQMAETLAADPKFIQGYATLLKASDKRRAETMPTDAEVIQEKEKIINDPDGTRMVMAHALLILQAHDTPRK